MNKKVVIYKIKASNFFKFIIVFAIGITMKIDDDLVNKVWEKGRQVEGVDPAMFRKDACGAWIARNKFANRDSEFGWVLDHIMPRSLGGPDCEENLRPMQIKNNISKGSDYPSYVACVTAEGEINVRKLRTLTVNDKIQSKIMRLLER